MMFSLTNNRNSINFGDELGSPKLTEFQKWHEKMLSPRFGAFTPAPAKPQGFPRRSRLRALSWSKREHCCCPFSSSWQSMGTSHTCPLPRAARLTGQHKAKIIATPVASQNPAKLRHSVAFASQKFYACDAALRGSRGQIRESCVASVAKSAHLRLTKKKKIVMLAQAIKWL